MHSYELSNWDKRFIQQTNLTASWSKDPRHKIGALIVDPVSNIVLSGGFNGFPRKMLDLEERYADRGQKNDFIVHAELNAIVNAARNGIKLEGGTLYCTLPPCNICMGAILQAGIKKVLHGKDATQTWSSKFKIALEMANEVGIEIWEVEGFCCATILTENVK